jgi:hypothetical protein
MLMMILLLGPGLPQIAAAAEQSCLKLVFNRYCLGGDLNRLAQQMPGARHDEGERSALIYYDGGEQDYVLAWRGRIYKVLRQYRIASQLRYEELYALLREKYGSGEDQSRFPAYAKTPTRRQIAIRRGEGRAAHGWPTDGGWHIELSWSRELGLSLAYIADELDRQQSAAQHSGL